METRNIYRVYLKLFMEKTLKINNNKMKKVDNGLLNNIIMKIKMQF